MRKTLLLAVAATVAMSASAQASTTSTVGEQFCDRLDDNYQGVIEAMQDRGYAHSEAGYTKQFGDNVSVFVHTARESGISPMMGYTVSMNLLLQVSVLQEVELEETYTAFQSLCESEEYTKVGTLYENLFSTMYSEV